MPRATSVVRFEWRRGSGYPALEDPIRDPLGELHHAKVMGSSRLLSRVPSLEGPGSQARYACRGESPGIQPWMTRLETPLEELHHAQVMGSSRLRRPCAQSESAALHGLARRL